MPLRKAPAIQRRLHAADLRRRGAEQALDALALGVCLLDETGCAIFRNRTADRLLGAADGLSVSVEGRLVATSPAERARLDALVREACASSGNLLIGPAGGVSITRPSGRRAFTVVVTPLGLRQLHLLPGLPTAAAFISNTEGDVTPDALLREIYGLTRTEVVVAKLLVEGLKVEEIMARLDVAMATVRTHVRRVLEKTSARGQADLIRILLSGPSALAAAAQQPHPAGST
jgi:DNA-binding CsgD family transcriptional regulator